MTFLKCTELIQCLAKIIVKTYNNYGSESQVFIVLLTLAGFYILFGAAAPVLQPDAQPAVFNEQAFCNGFYQVLDRYVIPNLEQDFSEQIARGVSSPEGLNALLNQLPFEPDNLGTGDCVFNACCCVLLLDTLRSPDQQVKMEILTRIAVLTFLRHSSIFFEKYFCAAFEKSKGTTVSTVSASELYKTWSMNYETNSFSNYKYDLLNKMAKYVTATTRIPITIQKIENDKKNPLRNGSFFISYVNCKQKSDAIFGLQADLISAVKRMTCRLVVLNRIFGQIDDGGETGTIQILEKCRELSFLAESRRSEDEYDIHQCVYSRQDGPFSSIVVQYDPSENMKRGNVSQGATLVLQIPTTAIDSTAARFLGISQGVQVPTRTYVRKTEQLIVDEQPVPHAITATADIALRGKNLWFSGDRGLTPEGAPWTCTAEMIALLVGPQPIQLT